MKKRPIYVKLKSLFIYLFRLRWVLAAPGGIFIAACLIAAYVGFSVAACMWDLVPQPRIEPGPPALGAQSLTHWTTREAPNIC